MSVTVKVRVPGTTANCGPGFDTVGIACNIYNYMTLTLSDQSASRIEISGEGAGTIPVDDRNIALRAVREILRRVDSGATGIRIRMENNIPLARGLGSSAAAIVAGLVAANAATGSRLSAQDIFEIATRLEGHPDNVAPAIFGGVTVSMLQGNTPRTLRFIPPHPLKLVVAVPEFTLSTRTARQVLPKTVSFHDAVFNVSRTALLIGALCQGRYDSLKYALEDRLHQPYREKLIPGMPDVLAAAVEKGALGAALSGAGPCLIAFTQRNEPAIGEAMIQAFAQHGIKASYLPLNIDTSGAKVLTTP
ncbi:MAG: homoserine kinase [Negativicutes bacterium]|nr:homoserine kinase [Negativicutes bacterium]